MDNKLLTIAIPTYNRREKLKKCLDAVIPQMSERITIIVRDNHSTSYDFYEFIQPYVNKYGVIAFQNEYNIGGDANFLKLFEDCKTEWIWILGDDDILKNDAVKTVISKLDDFKNAVFIKFNSRSNFITNNLHDFASFLDNVYDFPATFFISEGIHHVSLSAIDIANHYKYLSLKTSQIIRVMMHIRSADNNNDVVFLSDSILEEHGEDITWTHFELVPYLLLYFDLFYTERKVFKKNIFKSISYVCWLYTSESKIPISQKLYYKLQILQRYGVLNVMKYTFPNLLRYRINMFLPRSIKDLIKSIIKY